VKKVSKLADVTPDARNANKGTERGRRLLEYSLRNFGAGRSIVVDKNGRAIAGNKTLEVAAELGLPVKVVKTDGKALVIVQRDDLDIEQDKRARELAYADNRVSEVDLSWDENVIAEDVNAGIDLGTMFSDKELDDLIGDLVQDDPKADAKDEEEQKPGQWQRAYFFELAFDDQNQRERWYAFMRFLRDRFPGDQTIGARLDKFLASVEGFDGAQGA